ncbi:protein phosphatase 2C domain-containing protein [Tessaracoccus sp. OS52]|uniref:PP2C family protein-serine/threonine phosphatase n=1 Tax=Tessaracoccus sp. OS52 TaxID=2886691 RepID=UPI001D126BEF|nr:PP2C family protein-serine/threonine phosphatase [Tessaracoccus sp. OS52]MCC2592801.1 protein phosphatase 2C domain-containing protein [Tessaracoccus sp. OS52]
MTQPTQPTKGERSHYVRVPAPWIAGCSDVGLKHRSNQDAFCLAARPGDERTAVLAVADGVSTAAGSELASLVASEAACMHLANRIEEGTAPNLAFVQAFAEAQDAVLSARQGDDAAACTLVAGIMTPDSIAVGNVGDSRAYWLGDDGLCLLLSTDDSMAQARIMLGMSRAEAEQSNQAHSITKWLGRDAANVTPSVITHQPTTNGWLLLCTDGLWNYASSPEEMHHLVKGFVERTASPGAIAEGLVDWANSKGGRDNITVAVARYEA